MKTIYQYKTRSPNEQLTISSHYSECGGLVTEPLEELFFQRGDKITETECQWNIGDISEPNGDHVILVVDPVDSCR